jgi:hypothetical protein
MFQENSTNSTLMWKINICLMFHECFSSFLCVVCLFNVSGRFIIVGPRQLQSAINSTDFQSQKVLQSELQVNFKSLSKKTKYDSFEHSS